MTSLLPSAVALGAVALVALGLTSRRSSPPGRAAERGAAARSLLIALGAQSAHFAEELATGFHERLPALFGQPAMPLEVFVGFNAAWLAAWGASVPGLRTGRRPAFFAAWFLAVGGVLNLVGHPVLALAAGGYFPGLASSPFLGVAAALLWLRLREATRDGPGAGE